MKEKNLLARLLVLQVWCPWIFPEGWGYVPYPDPSAVPRKNKEWRVDWQWIVLQTEHFSPRYHMHFQTEGKSRRYLRLLCTRYVAVRIGPESTRFIATEPLYGGTVELPLRLFLDLAPKENMFLALRLLGIDPEKDVTWI